MDSVFNLLWFLLLYQITCSSQMKAIQLQRRNQTRVVLRWVTYCKFAQHTAQLRYFSNKQCQLWAQGLSPPLTISWSRAWSIMFIKQNQIIQKLDQFCSFSHITNYMVFWIVVYFQAQTFFVDLWALGIFVFEMLTGKAPFKHKNRQALAKAILGGIDPKLEVR